MKYKFLSFPIFECPENYVGFPLILSINPALKFPQFSMKKVTVQFYLYKHIHAYSIDNLRDFEG